ncbi:MAG: SCP2 sterol-binding domain-containing protein [bacterium]|nr:SCP2 sterol-binding domain-containing protein [bacterium]
MKKFLLGSIEHLKEIKRKTNSNKEYLKLAKGENATYILILEKEPEMDVTETVEVGFVVKNGKIIDVFKGIKPATHVLTAPYGVWVKILKGELDLRRAYLERILNVTGDFAYLMKYLQATIKWIEILRSIPVELHGKYKIT